MDGVKSLVSQAQPLRGLPAIGLHNGATPDKREDVPSGPPTLFALPPFGVAAALPAALPTAAAPTVASPLPAAIVPSLPAAIVSPAVPPGQAGLPAAASPAPAPGPAPVDPAVVAARRANRIHRRRYTLPDPFGINRKRPRRRKTLGLPGRLAGLIDGRRDLARLTDRLRLSDIGWPWFRAGFTGPVKKDDRRRYRELVEGGLSPMPAMVLAGMLGHTMTWSSRGQRARLIEGLSLLRPTEVREVADFLFVSPITARALRRTYMVQERLELYQGGDSFSTYLRFARHFAGSNNPLPQSAQARAFVQATPVGLAAAPLDLRVPWEAHGRTLHFTGIGGASMGLKLRKDAADASALEREDVMDRCFAAWKPALGLEGTFPKSHGLLLFAPGAEVRAAIAAQAAAHGTPQFDIGTAPLMPALLYEAPPDYHVHLHEVPSLRDLEAASRKALHDAGTLAGRLGLVHMSPADFYHNREKDRRWYWNVDQVKKAMFGRVGTGRLDRVDAGVRYYNAGPSGLRDLKHLAFFDEVKADYGDDATLALTSTMGDFMLAWTLSVCKWFSDHGQLDMGLDLQSVLHNGFTTYFAAFTGRDAVAARRFLEAMVDWPLLTRQIQYFCSTAYVADVKQDRVAPAVLGFNTTAHARRPAEGWDAEKGWMLDGETPDLGPKNGPFPLTELVAALYVTTHFGVALRKPNP